MNFATLQLQSGRKSLMILDSLFLKGHVRREKLGLCTNLARMSLMILCQYGRYRFVGCNVAVR